MNGVSAYDALASIRLRLLRRPKVNLHPRTLPCRWCGHGYAYHRIIDGSCFHPLCDERRCRP